MTLVENSMFDGITQPGALCSEGSLFRKAVEQNQCFGYNPLAE